MLVWKPDLPPLLLHHQSNFKLLLAGNAAYWQYTETLTTLALLPA